MHILLTKFPPITQYSSNLFSIEAGIRALGTQLDSYSSNQEKFRFTKNWQAFSDQSEKNLYSGFLALSLPSSEFIQPSMPQLSRQKLKTSLAFIVVARYLLAFQTLAQNVISPRCTSFSGLRKTSSPIVPEAILLWITAWSLPMSLKKATQKAWIERDKSLLQIRFEILHRHI